MKIERIWAMPNKYTFTIKPIKELLQNEVNGGIWIDPFAGFHSPAQVTNDLDPLSAATSHMDALEFLRLQQDNNYDGGFYDPPYSISQATECYKGFGKQYLTVKPSSMLYWKSIKNELARVIKPGGKVICCGWSSMGLGKSRRFEMTRILLVPHGGSKNDTIVTVERKL